MALDLIRLTGIDANDGIELVDPDTGEVVTLANATPQLIAAVMGRYELAIRDDLDALRDAKRLLGAELLARMDKGGEWTVRSRGVRISAPSPTAGTVTWDAELLDQILDGLVAGGLINQHAKLRAVSQETTLVPHDAGIKALLKIPAVAEAIQPAKRTSEPPRRSVSVKIDPGQI